MKRKRDQSRRRDDYDMIGRKTTRHGDMRVAGTGISGWNLNCKCAGGYTKRIDDVRRVRRVRGTSLLARCSRPMGSRWVSVGNTLREGIGDTGNSQPAVRQGAALAIYVGSRI